MRSRSAASLPTELEHVTYAVLWQAQAEPLPDRTASQLPDATDVVVVGGGYTGLATARQLARDGASVAVLEAERIGWGASSRNGGMCLPGFKYGPAGLVQHYGEDLGRALHDESLAAVEDTAALVAEEGIRADLRLDGHLELAYAPAHVRDLAAMQRELEGAGTAARMLGRDELRAEIGTGAYHGALLVERSGGLHPGRYVAGLAQAATRAGAGLHEGVRATAIRPQADGRYVVETSRGGILARQVVVATNGYTGGLVPALRRRIIPIGSYIIATAPLSEDLAAELSPKGRMFFDTKNFLYYWRLTPDRRMLFGGRVSFMPTSTEQTALRLWQGMVTVHPQLRGTPVEFAWGGNVGFTWDRMPHAGRLGGRLGGVAYAMGYCGSGVAFSTYLGRRLAEWLGGGPAPALSRLPFPLIRAPYEGRPWFMPLVGEWYRTRDRLAGRDSARELARTRADGGPAAG